MENKNTGSDSSRKEGKRDKGLLINEDANLLEEIQPHFHYIFYGSFASYRKAMEMRHLEWSMEDFLGHRR